MVSRTRIEALLGEIGLEVQEWGVNTVILKYKRTCIPLTFDRKMASVSQEQFVRCLVKALLEKPTHILCMELDEEDLEKIKTKFMQKFMKD